MGDYPGLKDGAKLHLTLRPGAVVAKTEVAGGDGSGGGGQSGAGGAK